MTDPQWLPVPETDFDTCKCYCHIDAMLPGRPGGPCDSCRHAPSEPNAIALPVDIARFVSFPMTRVDVRQEMSAFELRGVVLRGGWRMVIDTGVKNARGEARCFKNREAVAYGADLVLEGEDVLRIEWSCELPPAARVWVAFENTTSTPRDERQAAVVAWVRETFGVEVMTPHERAMRFLEESIELVQAAGVDRACVESLVDHVYGRAPGDVAQEAGGAGITLLAFCASAGLSADACEAAEFARALKIDKATFQARHNAKADAGVAMRVTVTNHTDQPMDVSVTATMKVEVGLDEGVCCNCGLRSSGWLARVGCPRCKGIPHRRIDERTGKLDDLCCVIQPGKDAPYRMENARVPQSECPFCKDPNRMKPTYVELRDADLPGGRRAFTMGAWSGAPMDGLGRPGK